MEANRIDPLVGAVLERRYLLVERIARGGMAAVYRGLDQRLDRLVAVKVLDMGRLTDGSGSPELTPEVADQIAAGLQHEAKTTARLNHPHVVAVFDHGVHDGLPYLVMEYVPGRTLRRLLTEQRRLDPATTLHVFEPILDALAAAHRVGLVHRDVKPENVLISDSGTVKVADFGLARAVNPDTHQAADEHLLVTAAYVAPEQVTSGWADARSDVYSAGVMLFEMLTGELPYRADTPLQVAYQHVERDVPAPSGLVPGLPPALDDLVHRATRREHQGRLADADAFVAQLRTVREAVLAGGTEPVPEIRPAVEPGESSGGPRRPGKRLAFAALGAAAALLAVLLAVAFWPSPEEPPAPPTGQDARSPSTSPTASPQATSPQESSHPPRTSTPKEPESDHGPDRSSPPPAAGPGANPSACPTEFKDEWWYDDYCT